MSLSNPRSYARIALPAALALALTMSTGCQQSKMVTGGVRAIWVTRGDYRSPDDVAKIMEDCSKGGFNVVVFGNDVDHFLRRYDDGLALFYFLVNLCVCLIDFHSFHDANILS